MRAPTILLKRKLRILSLARWDYAACGYFLSEAIKATTEHESTAVRSLVSTLGFPCEVLDPTDEELRELWLRADVVHIHDDAELPLDVPPRPVIVTYHGSYYRGHEKERLAMCRERNWLATAATLDLTERGLPWLPDCRPSLGKYVKRTPGQFVVCHAPTKRRWKGTEAIVDAGLDDLVLIERTPWEETLRLKGTASVTIDQFKIGPGCNAIEAWAMGQAVIGNLEKIELLTKVVDELPFVRCEETPQAIYQAVNRLKRNSIAYREAAIAGSAHYSRFHAPEAAARIALKCYWTAMEMFYGAPSRIWSPNDVPAAWDPAAKRPVAPGEAGMVALRYIGGNIGRETFTGPETGTLYEFSAEKHTRYVDTRDISAMLKMRTKGRPEFRRA